MTRIDSIRNYVSHNLRAKQLMWLISAKTEHKSRKLGKLRSIGDLKLAINLFKLLVMSRVTIMYLKLILEIEFEFK